MMRWRIDKFYITTGRVLTSRPRWFYLPANTAHPPLPRQTARRNRFLFFLSEINHLFVRPIAIWLFFRQCQTGNA